jgi:hypothetical protein
MTKYLRSTALFIAAAVPLACAHVEAPRGGPPITEPPDVVSITPDSLATVTAFQGPVVFSFDERLSERGIDDRIVWVSPRTSGVRVDHRGSTLRVSLRAGWEPNRIYHVTVLPGIADLFGNRRTEAITTVFSTGPEIPETRLVATVVDRLTGRPAVGARVEAITPDSLVYALPVDTAGVADFRRLPLAEYRVRAYTDVNRNRELDAFEPRDLGTVVVSSADSVGIALSIVAPDTTPPQLATIRVSGENLEARFDDHLDPEQPLGGRVQIIGPDGAHVTVAQVGVGSLPREQEQQDQPQAEEEAGAAPRRARLPSQTLVIRPAVELEPGAEYRVRISGIRNVVGLAADVEGTFTAPERPAQAAPGGAEEPSEEAAPAQPPTESASAARTSAPPRRSR